MSMTAVRLAGCVLLAALFPGPLAAAVAELVEVRRIWDEAPHNAFTDLLRHDGRWFCVFREGQAHVSPDGALRVIASEDGRDWQSAARITLDAADLRDAKLTVTPDGRLMLSGAAAYPPPSEVKHQSLAWFSDDGRAWGEPVQIGEPNYWLWRVTWHDDVAWGVGYATAGAEAVRLYRSEDGKDFETAVETLFDKGYPNEASLLFVEDESDATALCLLRRDGDPHTAQLGTSRPPYTEWVWKDLGVRIGGPQLTRIPDGRIIAAGRSHDGGARTRLWRLDPDAGRLETLLTLPSGGDTSYPGLVFHDGLLWVSYYSSHEGRTSIYLAKVRLPE